MKKRYHALSGLKVFYSITIFLSHLNVILCTDLGKRLYRYFESGSYGVSFFFVVSGFLMYLNYYDKFQVLNRENYSLYAKKKIKKLYPMYAATMLVFAAMELQRILANGTLSWDVLKDFLARIFLSGLMLQTLSTRTEVSQALNSAGWFLSCIMILYFITPPVFWMLQKIRSRLVSDGTLLFIICFALSAFFYYLWEKNPQQTGLFYCTPYIRFFHYFLGVSTGMVFKNKELCINRLNNSLSGEARPHRRGKHYGMPFGYDILEAVLVVFNLYAWLIRYWGAIPSGIMQLFAASLTVFIFAHEKGFISRWIKNSRIIKLECLCFDFYLLHYTVISLINHYYMPRVAHMTDIHMVLLCLAALMISGGLSYFSAKFISGSKRKV